jgi:hypothetical protein
MKAIIGKRLFLPVVFLAALVILSCGEEVTEPGEGSSAPRITISSGDNQTERTGAQLPEPLTMRVTNQIGAPFVGMPVEFTTTDPGAVVTPATANTDADGYASCRFTLGTVPGKQSVAASIENDTKSFSANALEIECPEDGVDRVCHWPSGHIFITTTSSSLIMGPYVSVLFDFDPGDDSIEPVLQTTENLLDLSFSSRGELFVTTSQNIYKVNHLTKQLELYGSYGATKNVELVDNPGGIMAGISDNEIFDVTCPTNIFTVIYSYVPFFVTILPENFACDPVTRDLYIMKGTAPLRYLVQADWDGRSILTDLDLDSPGTVVDTGTGEPRGMCVDSMGTVYISNDGVQPLPRKIIAVTADKEISTFFDFYEYYDRNNTQAGRWGDITILENKLYLIDRRNDRLVVIDITESGGTMNREVRSDIFSLPYEENERYGIAASPNWLCAGG